MLLEHLQQAYPDLSKSQRRLAAYLVVNYRQAAFMTSSQLAQAVQVHEATVTRFAQHLGYVGYPELLADLRSLINEELEPTATAINYPNDRPVSLALLTISNRLANLNQHLNTLIVMQARDLLASASQVLVLGQGAATSLVLLFKELLVAAGKTVTTAAGDPFALANAVVDASPGQLVIGISCLDDSLEVASALRFAGQHQANTLAIASSPTSSLAQAAKVAITWLADEAQPTITLAVAASLLAALAQSLEQPDPALASIRQTNLTLASDMILARRRR
ncbi:MAG: MurR/RpiR family transcriptional regulator [Anaerolineae bacterium]